AVSDMLPFLSRASLRPLQLACQESERPLAVNHVATGEKLNLRPLGQAQLGVESADLRILVSHPLIDADSVIMATLHHEWPGSDQGCHLRVTKGIAQIEFVHLVFAREHVARR